MSELIVEITLVEKAIVRNNIHLRKSCFILLRDMYRGALFFFCGLLIYYFSLYKKLIVLYSSTIS